MASAKVSRKELLKKPDEFITFSAKTIIFAREHSQQFKYLGIGIIALIFVFLGINMYMKYINKKGQTAFNEAYYTLVGDVSQSGNTLDLKKVEELFNAVIDNYSISKSALLTLPELGYVNFKQKKYDEAISRYQMFLDKAPDDPYISLARIGLAVCYEEKGDFDKAIQSLEYIRQGPDDFFKEQAMLSLARVYRLTRKEEKSNEILKEFIEKFSTSPFLSIAKAYIK